MNINPAPAMAFSQIFNSVRSGQRSPLADMFPTVPAQKAGKKRSRKMKKSNNKRKTVK